MKKVLIVDNEDSFVYNIVEYVRCFGGCDYDIILSKDIDITQTDSYEGLLLSPGANLPSKYVNMMRLIERCSATHKIFGVCLGHQAIAEHFGAEIVRVEYPKHGHTSCLDIVENDTIFKGIGSGTKVGRYHSWVVEERSLPKELIVTSRDEEGNIMSIKHKELPISSVQFHPESIMTEHGRYMINNWLSSE